MLYNFHIVSTRGRQHALVDQTTHPLRDGVILLVNDNLSINTNYCFSFSFSYTLVQLIICTIHPSDDQCLSIYHKTHRPLGFYY